MDEGFPLECAADLNTLRRMKKAHLADLAQSYGLDTGGLKETLVKRISDYAARELWIEQTGHQQRPESTHAAVALEPDLHPTPPTEHSGTAVSSDHSGTLKRIASTFGFPSFSTSEPRWNPEEQEDQGDVSMSAPPAVADLQQHDSPAANSDYTRRYSFLPEDSLDSTLELQSRDDDGSSFVAGSPDSRPAIRSIPSKLSLPMESTHNYSNAASTHNMLLDDTLNTTKAAAAVFGQQQPQRMEEGPPAQFGDASMAQQEFSFKSPPAAPSMPVGPSISSLFHAFMSSKDKKPDRFAAAHEQQFSRMQSIAPRDKAQSQQQQQQQQAQASVKRKREDDDQASTHSNTSRKQGLMSRSIESLRSKMSKHDPSSSTTSLVSTSRRKSPQRPPVMQSKPRTNPRKGTHIVLLDADSPAKPQHTPAQMRLRLAAQQKARRRSSVPGEKRLKPPGSAVQAKAKLKCSLTTSSSSSASNRSHGTNTTANGSLPRYACPTETFQAKSSTSMSNLASSFASRVKSTVPLQPQPPLHPRFGVPRVAPEQKKESNGAVIIGFAKSHPSAENGRGGAQKRQLPRFAAGTESSRAKTTGNESPRKRQRLNANVDKPLPMTPGRARSTTTRPRTRRPAAASPRKLTCAHNRI